MKSRFIAVSYTHLDVYKRQTQGKIDILLENYKLLNTPIVRNGKLATVGYKKEIWDTWE